MGTVKAMIKISSPEQQLRQNRAMLLLIGGISSLGGLLIWSATPFAANDPKNPVHVSLRYIALVSGLVCGVSAVACGHQLEKISPLIEAMDAAEKRDFLTQLAVACHVQETQHKAAAMLALSPASQPESQIGNAVTESGNAVPEPVTNERNQPVTESVTDGVTAETHSETHPLTEGYKPMYLAVTTLQRQGVSESKIIKEVLGQEGRNYEKGKQSLQALLTLGQQQGW
jgi:hypothetical protein